MLERLFTWLQEWVGLLKCAIIVEQFEAGVILRLGTYHRTIRGGFHWHWPLGLEQVLTDRVVLTVTPLDPQSLTTSDGESIVIAATLTWEVADIEVLLLKVDHKEHAILDAAPSVIANMVAGRPWREIASEDFASEVTKKVRAKAKRYGIHVVEVALRDCVRSKAIRLIQPLAHAHEI